MDRPRRGIAAELVAVTLIAGCLAGALALVIVVHRRQPPQRPTAPAVVVLPAIPEIAAKPAPFPIVAPAPPPPAPRTPVDPTPRLVAELAAAEVEQRAETDKAYQRIGRLEAASRAARAESDRWKRTLAVARTQIGAREGEARAIEGKAEMSTFERDALARRRDALKQVAEQDRNRPSYAVLPHRGPNGTWQRPIVLECDAEGVHVRPNGPTFDITDIASVFGLRGNAFLMAITREALRVQRGQGPDGADVTPYIFFIVRPSGIRAYYESRTRLERLGIAFGYELADAEWKIDFPDLDQPETWDGSPPMRPDATAAIDRSTSRGTGMRPSRAEIDEAFRWPKSAPDVEGRGSSLGGLSLPGSERGGIGDGRAGLESEPAGVGASGPSETQSLARGGFGGGGSDGEPAQGDWADSWDRALRRSGPSRMIGRVPWARGESALGSGSDGMGDLDRLNARGGARPIDPTSGVPGGQTAWEAATSGASPPAGGGGDLSTDRGQMPTGSPRLGQISGRMPPLPSRSGGDPPPPAAGAPDGAAALGGSGTASAGSPPAGEGESAGQPAQADAAGSGSPGASSAGRPPAESGGSGAQKAGSPPAEGQGQGQAGGGENASTNGQMQSGTAGDGQKAGQSSNSSAGQAGDRRSQAKAGDPGSPGGPPSPFGSTPRASRPFQLVLACGPKGVAVQPGDYRVTKATLRAKETLLIAQLRAIVREEETLHPGRPLRPSIRYLIQPGGHETYTIARGQLDFSDLAWPGSVGFTGGDAPRLFSTDDW